MAGRVDHNSEPACANTCRRARAPTPGGAQGAGGRRGGAKARLPRATWCWFGAWTAAWADLLATSGTDYLGVGLVDCISAFVRSRVGGDQDVRRCRPQMQQGHGARCGERTPLQRYFRKSAAVFVLTRDHRVKWRFVCEDFELRLTGATILEEAVGANADQVRTPIVSRNVQITATATNTLVGLGNRIRIAVELKIPKGFHVYSPEVGSGYIGVSWQMDRSECLEVEEPVYPQPEWKASEGERREAAGLRRYDSHQPRDQRQAWNSRVRSLGIQAVLPPLCRSGIAHPCIRRGEVSDMR